MPLGRPMYSVKKLTNMHFLFTITKSGEAQLSSRESIKFCVEERTKIQLEVEISAPCLIKRSHGRCQLLLTFTRSPGTSIRKSRLLHVPSRFTSTMLSYFVSCNACNVYIQMWESNRRSWLEAVTMENMWRFWSTNAWKIANLIITQEVQIVNSRTKSS